LQTEEKRMSNALELGQVGVTKVTPGLLRDRYRESVTFIAAAGFEARSIGAMVLIREAKIKVIDAFILDYPNRDLNEPNRSVLIAGLRSIRANVSLIDVTEEGVGIKDAISPLGKKVIVDVSSMDRMVIFSMLFELDRRGLPWELIYTEAEKYFPPIDFFLSLVKNDASNDVAFSRYLETEKSEFAYSHESRLIRLAEFFGNPEPGRPFMLISFFAFKRARLQLLMQDFEFEKKVFVLGAPVRNDLSWRKRCMEIVNWDLIRKNPGAVRELPTLYPAGTEAFLEDVAYRSGDFARYNILLAPLGSKMQSIGCYNFWKRHSEIGLVFSHPRSFFPPSYSESYRDTFLYTRTSPTTA
jgi:hypothetical protein